jgi:ubiquitin C-terminal hydrolase
MNNNINFPLFGFDLEPYVAFPKTGISYLYDLYGVVNHYGTMGGGHYTSYIKSMGDWFDYNDSSVT